MALKAYLGLRPATWTAKTKFIFFCWLSFYFKLSEFLYHHQKYCISAHHSETIKYIDIDKYVDIDIYTEITWAFFLAMAQNEYTERERELGKFDSFWKLSFVWRTWLINLKGVSTTWWKMSVWQVWVLNKHKASNEGAKEFTWKLWNIMNLLILFTLEQNS